MIYLNLYFLIGGMIAIVSWFRAPEHEKEELRSYPWAPVIIGVTTFVLFWPVVCTLQLLGKLGDE